MSPGTLGGISLGYLTVRVASLHLGSKEFAFRYMEYINLLWNIEVLRVQRNRVEAYTFWGIPVS